MTISSPRFANVLQLTQAAQNRPPLSVGSRGHGVHLVQFALIDLGYAMPRSMGKNRMSPDGVFGSETKGVVEAFQASSHGGPAVKDDGIVGQNTMAKLDRAIGGYTHRLPVTIWTVKQSALSIFAMVREAQEVYGHYGIKFEVRYGRCVPLSDADHDAFRSKKTKLPKLVEIAEKKIGVTFTATDTTVVQLGRFDPDDVYGVALSNQQKALVRISDDATVSTLAHEVGHIVLTPASGHDAEDHTSYVHNIMTDGSERRPYVLGYDQVKEMRAHARCPKI